MKIISLKCALLLSVMVGLVVGLVVVAKSSITKDDSVAAPLLPGAPTGDDSDSPRDVKATYKPVAKPTEKPAYKPTVTPTYAPTTKPPTDKPTYKPTNKPTNKPPNKPTAEPSDKPTNNATNYPSVEPTADSIPSYDDFRDTDPFYKTNPDDANLWRTNGTGLRLTIINALDDNWHDNFNTTVSQWDAGTPDALTLTTEINPPDRLCRADDGRVKVCNGNYGETKWRGINKVLLENGWIYSAAVRMNDFYFKDSDTAQKQYTMCHEIGHALGLPHTDEDSYNEDLNNCMDYTSRPEKNKQPAEPNFQFLTKLYGSIDGTIPQGGTSTDTLSLPSSRDTNDRRLRGRSPTSNVLPSEIERALDEIDALVDLGMIGAEIKGTSQRKGWRLLHASEQRWTHEIDLGDGYAVQLHMLGAVPQR